MWAGCRSGEALQASDGWTLPACRACTRSVGTRRSAWPLSLQVGSVPSWVLVKYTLLQAGLCVRKLTVTCNCTMMLHAQAGLCSSRAVPDGMCCCCQTEPCRVMQGVKVTPTAPPAGARSRSQGAPATSRSTRPRTCPRLPCTLPGATDGSLLPATPSRATSRANEPDLAISTWGVGMAVLCSH